MCRSHQSATELLGKSSHWLEKHCHSNYRRPVDVGGGTPRPVLLTLAKKSHLGCPISSSYLYMGFQNFVGINKIYPLKKILSINFVRIQYHAPVIAPLLNPSQVPVKRVSNSRSVCRLANTASDVDSSAYTYSLFSASSKISLV